MLPRAFYALQDTKTPVAISITSVTLSVFLNWFFLNYTHLGVGGFALSFSIMGFVNMILLMIILRRKIHGIRGQAILTSFVKTMLASIVMGAVIWVLQNVIVSMDLQLGGHWEAAIVVVCGMGAGMLVFFSVAWLLKMEEFAMVLRLFKQKLFRKREV
jgi:putative peptidoglycan lipid II flippase